VWVREYLKDPPTREELRALYDRAGLTPREGLRAREPLATELGLTRPELGREWLPGPQSFSRG